LFQKVYEYGSGNANVSDEEVSSSTRQQQELVTQLTGQYSDLPINNTGNITNRSTSHQVERAHKLLAKNSSVKQILTDMTYTDLWPPDSYLVLASHLMWNNTEQENSLMQGMALPYTGLYTGPVRPGTSD
jgi:hypothetical protein